MTTPENRCPECGGRGHELANGESVCLGCGKAWNIYEREILEPTTRPCVFCHRPIPLAGGLLCPGCVEHKKLVAAGGVRNCPESHKHASQARRLLEKHWRWVREGHVPEFAQT